MQPDPFGNLVDWAEVLDLLTELSENGRLEECQPGLMRILRYKGNWRLREEVLKLLPNLKNPIKQLLFEILAILDDDNTYYDARILAGDALIPLLRKTGADYHSDINVAVMKVVEKIESTPQPPFFIKALTPLYSAVGLTDRV